MPPIKQMLASLFERCMKRRGVRETDPYDWEKLDQTSNANMANIAGNNMQNDIIDKNEQQIHGNNITQMTVAGSNASGHEYVSKFFYSLTSHIEIVVYMSVEDVF